MSNSYMWHATEKDLVAIDKGRGYEIRTLHFDPDRPGHADARPLVNMIQVIGHTQTKHVTFNMNTMNPVIQVDALGAWEYLIIEDEKYSVWFIKDLITW